MKNISIFPLERNHYFYGKLLTVRDFELEQKYFNDKRRLINRVLHGAGVVCGLGVVKSDDAMLMVESGMALDYMGREIVLPAPDIKALPMLEGYESILGRTQAFLCLKYRETMRETVNAVGAESGKTEQSNKYAEGYSLYLDAGDPDIPSLIDADAGTSTVMLYQSDGAWIALSAPRAIASSKEFMLECLVVKGAEVSPVSFSMEFHSDFFTTVLESHDIRIAFDESPENRQEVYHLQYRLRATNAAGMLTKLCEKPVSFQLRIGDQVMVSNVELDQDVYICKNEEEAVDYLREHDTLTDKWSADPAIYLAKLDLIPSPATALIRGVVNLPFGQRVCKRGAGMQPSGGGTPAFQVESEVNVLKYWQKPEVQAQYNEATGMLNFRFGLPSTEANDYATTSGVVDIPFTDGMRVNGRYFSEEIPHNLGAGNVSVTLAVEYGEGESRGMLFGNGEVFRTKNGDRAVPQIETGAVLYPERGTFRIGIWLMDSVEGTGVRVRYFASKVTNDLDELKRKNAVSIRVVPEIQRIRVRERLHLKAVVTGSDNKNVSWAVKDKNGGSIDANGIYLAPDTAGTYEIIATASVDEGVSISAFVIVEE